MKKKRGFKNYCSPSCTSQPVTLSGKLLSSGLSNISGWQEGDFSAPSSPLTSFYPQSLHSDPLFPPLWPQSLFLCLCSFFVRAGSLPGNPPEIRHSPPYPEDTGLRHVPHPAHPTSALGWDTETRTSGSHPPGDTATCSGWRSVLGLPALLSNTQNHNFLQ